jgi:hypothetical protein
MLILRIDLRMKENWKISMSAGARAEAAILSPVSRLSQPPTAQPFLVQEFVQA